MDNFLLPALEPRADLAQLALVALVVREGLKGNHLLFASDDLAGAAGDGETVDRPVALELATAVLALARLRSADRARAYIAALSAPCRSQLARMYVSFLGRCARAQGNVS